MARLLDALLLACVLLLSACVSAQGLDLSTFFFPKCGVPLEDFVEKNQRVCYRTIIEGDPSFPLGCTAELIAESNFSVTFEPVPSLATTEAVQAKIWSPGKIQSIPTDYQNNQYCEYHLVCPEGQVLYFGFRDGNFDLEPETDGFCLDYVFIEDLSSGSFTLCGSQTQRSWFRAAPLRAEFRSSTGGQYPGFQIDALCVRPEFADLPNCDPLPDDGSAMAGRRRRATPGLSMREKRTAVPLTGNSVHVPRSGSILYQNYVLKVVVNGTVVRKFRSIRRLFFWTGFNGTRVFHRSTDEFIFGSGNLKIIKDCAYYYTLDIPPALEPNEPELEFITLLLNATAPFFREEEVPTTPPPTTPPPTKYPPHHHHHTVVGRHTRYRRSNSSLELDPRISPQAFATAINWQNACNVFLRESALSYLLILSQNGILP